MKKLSLFIFCCLIFSCVVPLNEIKKNKLEGITIDPPTAIIVFPNTVNSALLSWQIIDNSSSFSIYISKNEFSDYALVDTTDKNYYIIHNLLTETRYYFKLSVAKNNIGESQLSSPVSIVIVDLPEPTGLLATNSSQTTINISWSLILEATGYKVYRALSSSGPYTYVGNSATNNYTDNNLETGTTYYYKVAGTKSNGEGPSSNFVSAFTPVDIPTGLTGTVYSLNSIQLSWNAVSKATDYTLYKSLSPLGVYGIVITTSNTSYIDTGLSQNTPYYYKISAKNMNGEGTQSSYITVLIEPPYPPTNITSSVLSSSSIRLDWQNVTGATGYKIYRSTGGEYSLVGTVSGNSFTNTGLSMNVNYYYKISSVNIAGEGEKSEQINVIIQSPSTPLNIVTESYTDSSIKITWDDVSGATLYKVYLLERDIAGGYYSELATVSTNEYIHTGLISGYDREYQYYVRAINSIGTSDYSSRVSGFVKPISLNKSIWYSSSFSYNYWQGFSNSPRYYSIPITGENIKIRIEGSSGTGSIGLTIFWNQNNVISPLGTSMESITNIFQNFEMQITPPSYGYIILRLTYSASYDTGNMNYRILFE